MVGNKIKNKAGNFILNFRERGRGESAESQDHHDVAQYIFYDSYIGIIDEYRSTPNGGVFSTPAHKSQLFD